ncbi:hypothetical protein [Nocardiopsis alba]|uniref:hypothetical protein n=1 Tax=Nocardiopsis alba TaxID=53437 RepID=UPI0033A929F6
MNHPPEYPAMPETPPAPHAPPPEPDPKTVRPGRLWYWIGGSLLPAAILFTVVVLTLTEWYDVPFWVGLICIVLLVLSVPASLGVVITTYAVRANRMSRARAERARVINTSHGYPSPMGPPVGPPVPRTPSIPSADVRPRRRWFLVAPLIPPVFVGVALLLLSLFGMNTFTSSETPGPRSDVVEGYGSTTFVVDSEDLDSLGLYVSPRDAEEVTCSFEESYTLIRFAERSVGHSWDDRRLMYSLEVSSPGEYTMTCQGPSEASYVVAETRTAHEDDRRGATTFLSLMAGTGLGVLAMIATVITIGVRRGTYRERMARGV